MLERHDDGAVDGLSLVLDEGSLREKARALEALGAIPGPKADAAICDAFRKGRVTRASALRLLAVRGASCLAEAVKDASADQDAKLREAALEYLRKIAPGQRDEAYAGLLGSGFAEVRRAGVLGLAGNVKYSGRLEKMLDDPDADIRKDALQALLDQKYPLAGRLRSLLDDSDPNIARTALDQVLSLPGSRERTDLLISCCERQTTPNSVYPPSGVWYLPETRVHCRYS